MTTNYRDFIIKRRKKYQRGEEGMKASEKGWYQLVVAEYGYMKDKQKEYVESNKTNYHTWMFSAGLATLICAGVVALAGAGAFPVILLGSLSVLSSTGGLTSLLVRNHILKRIQQNIEKENKDFESKYHVKIEDIPNICAQLNELKMQEMEESKKTLRFTYPFKETEITREEVHDVTRNC